ncbi:MAG: DUF5715 family protein [Myxococcota bacterium]|nr:DUF5715 family protein [Myxococcota bacterium]
MAWCNDTRRVSRSPLSCLFPLTVVLALAGGPSWGRRPTALVGSAASMDKQNREMRRHRFSRIKSPRPIKGLVAKKVLVRVRPSKVLELAYVSFPFVRPAVNRFLKALAKRYWRECRAPLVVTSLLRPLSHQPRNASPRSVHPTGMAFDLRLPSGKCRRWLQRELVELERRGVLEATQERRPPHFHVALFPKAYERYLAAGGRGTRQRSAQASPRPPKQSRGSRGGPRERARSQQRRQREQRARPRRGRAPARRARARRRYRVKAGDSLWLIAQRHKTTPERLRKVNRLRSNLLQPGQELKIP